MISRERTILWSLFRKMVKLTHHLCFPFVCIWKKEKLISDFAVLIRNTYLRLLRNLPTRSLLGLLRLVMILTRLRPAVSLAVLTTVFFLTVHDSSAQAFRQTVESLKEVSEAVVIAKTVKSESFWNEDRSAILTRVFLHVEQSLTGSSPTLTEVIIPGGQIGSIIHEVSDMPYFVVDEESVVFIERHESGVNVVAGGALGKILIEKDPVTQIRSVSGTPFFLMSDSVQADDEEETGVSTPERIPEKKRMTLDEFKQRIK